MAEEVYKTIAGSAPEMLALIVVVVLFLQFLRSQGVANQTSSEVQNKAWRDYIAVQNDSWQKFIEVQMSMVLTGLKDTTTDINGLGMKFERLAGCVETFDKRLVAHETYVNTTMEQLKLLSSRSTKEKTNNVSR